MSTKRMVRVNELIKRTLAEELFRVLSGGTYDLASVSITRVNVSPDLRDAYVYVSILGHHGERERMIQVLEDHRKTFQRDIARSVKLRYTPRLSFRLDESIEQGDHVLNMISQIEAETAAAEETHHTDKERNG
jgi:ribosome-binding factor A